MIGRSRIGSSVTTELFRIFESRQELHAHSRDNCWAPDHTARLTSVRMVRLCRELALIDMPATAIRAVNNHWDRRIDRFRGISHSLPSLARMDLRQLSLAPHLGRFRYVRHCLLLPIECARFSRS